MEGGGGIGCPHTVLILRSCSRTGRVNCPSLHASPRITIPRIPIIHHHVQFPSQKEKKEYSELAKKVRTEGDAQKFRKKYGMAELAPKTSTLSMCLIMPIPI
ncbi:hypothetical protein A0H81_04531 [Grifola frondosa]|uniref:Uncharacterized protein n=1 Tax=Grifola frondosa TaxID=5627 RepID=A0A1C7MFD5_GRIFR|nr:hypothetical protein A0H81_04531 [Grifola frondosa]